MALTGPQPKACKRGPNGHRKSKTDKSGFSQGRSKDRRPTASEVTAT